MEQHGEKADNPTGELMPMPKGSDTEQHMTERHLCGPKSNQNTEAGDDQNGESRALLEAEGASKSASKLTDNATQLVASHGCSFLDVDGPWEDVPLSSDDEKEEDPSTKSNTKDSEAEQQIARDWCDVSLEDAHSPIEDDYVDLGSEGGGSQVSEDFDEWTVFTGSRDSRVKNIRQ